MYLGIDDTDSRNSMCTTFVGLNLILRLTELGYDIIGYPRLVRLNPNIPWKTRGNGSVIIRFGKGAGQKFKIGEYRGAPLYAYTHGSNPERNPSLKDLIRDVENLFVLEEPTTNPGAVLSETQLPESLYWKGVRHLVTVEYAERVLRRYNAEYVKYKQGRGIIGASAGIAWRARKKTYELLTYTEQKSRFVDEKSVIEMDRTVPTTFDNYDYENRYVAIMPSSSTPVLFGIRGVRPEPLDRARAIIKSSPYFAFLIYETNQGTDDHLVRKNIRDVHPYESVILRGKVTTAPERIEGGHVIFSISDGTGTVQCAAYEPTKSFRNIVSRLRCGDTVEVCGGVRAMPVTINIEKLKIIDAPPYLHKKSNPVCPRCNRKMESVGAGKGYRCRKCGYRVPESAANYEQISRDITGLYEVPVIARRHLAKPIKIMRNVF